MTLLAKALNPLPEKYHGLQDKEIRYRKRHLDLIMNKDVRDLFIQRSRILTFIRSFLNDRGLWRLSRPYYIVLPEEPPLVLITHHNALDTKLYLRIALELHLKRLIVGGFEKVFEIGRVFRTKEFPTSIILNTPFWNSIKLMQITVT